MGAMAFDPAAYMHELGGLADSDINIGLAALALAAADTPVASPERYAHQLDKIVQTVSLRFNELIDAGSRDDVRTRLAALKRAIAVDGKYCGDTETYNDLQNANLMRVMDRGKGLPISIAILYIHAGRGMGWDVAGLDFPGHFLCRIEYDGQRIIFDPFHDCRTLEAPDLRWMVKRFLGERAELSAAYFEPAKNRDILIRLQNNIKYRQIDAEDYEAALKTVETMRTISPNEYRLLLDEGVLSARTNRLNAAIAALEQYIKKTPDARDRHDAMILLNELKRSLN
jgi:regulator of sirC expression with transglutaminase-like and TPR domain